MHLKFSKFVPVSAKERLSEERPYEIEGEPQFLRPNSDPFEVPDRPGLKTKLHHTKNDNFWIFFYCEEGKRYLVASNTRRSEFILGRGVYISASNTSWTKQADCATLIHGGEAWQVRNLEVNKASPEYTEIAVVGGEPEEQ